ncbi:hypothetical protein LguiB_022678 [Lonicera macranthoides]
MRPPHNHQSLKCPRCDSINTKFCYYNNYNLSQPRHFCKSCRRYWTRGGVLRTVPVGGGCRKTKRSKPKSASNSHKSNNSQSSSESSSLTAVTTVSEDSPASPSTLINFQNHKLFVSQPVDPIFDPIPVVDRSIDGGIFPEIGSFTNLMTSSNDSSLLGFNISPYKLNHGKVEEQVLDPTAEIELSRWENRTTDGDLAAVDWQAEGDQGIFDLTGTVDQSYWSQAQWTDNDNPLNYFR